MSAIGSVIVMAWCLSHRGSSRRPAGAVERGLSVIVEGPRPSRPSQARAEPLDEAMGSLRYQELLLTPGSSPAWAISRRQMRQRPNLRKTACGRPQRWQRVYPRTANFGLRAALLTRAFLAICSSLLPDSAGGRDDGLAGEGEAEQAEQLAALVVVR